MIKPSNLSGKLLFSLLWESGNFNKHSDKVGNIFKKVSSVGRYEFTEFVSVNVSKLTNLCRAESMGLALLSFWCEFYNVEGWHTMSIKDIFTSKKEVFSMFKFTIMMLLNDKHTAEEMVTMTRYIHMEALVSMPNISRPSKMFEKMPNVFRSRLEVYLYRQLDILMYDYSVKGATSPSFGAKSRRWEGFLNPLLPRDHNLNIELDNQDQMLNLCYVGYLKNKDEDPEANSSGQLLSKIIGLEDEIPRTSDGQVDRRYLGQENPQFKTIRKHEYHKSLLKVLCNNALDRISKEKGVVDAREYLASQIFEYMSHESLDHFATLKATSNFSDAYYVYPTPEGTSYHRSKVIEKVIEKLSKKDDTSKDVLVVDYLQEALEQLEINKDLHICIFKKNQHGGLREIYVLDLNGRIVQKCVEDCARVILKEFQSETMMHPKNKFLIPEMHNSTAKKSFHNRFMTYATSDDAAKWNQVHYVTKFMMILCQLLPSYMHGFVIRSLQPWLSKKIKISDDLLKIFHEVDSLTTTDPVVQKVFNVFKGRDQTSWMKPGTAFIETETGMMQGILHYNSSLLHTLLLDHVSNMCRDFLNSHLKRTGQPAKVVIDNLQSSDDSAMMISVPVIGGLEDVKIAGLVHQCFKIKELLSVMLSIYRSIKSTTFTRSVVEFNSEFYFHGDVHRPTFRWVNAAILVTEQENLKARQEESYNLVTGIVQGGGSLLLSHLCHLSQGLLHYRLLGSSVSSLWPLYVMKLKHSLDPALGFFMVDHPAGTGLAGLEYLVWLLCKRTSLGAKYLHMFLAELKNNEVLSEEFKEITLETTSMGLFSRSAQISYGQSTKWQKIMKNFENLDDHCDIIDKEPMILYVKPKDVSEVNLKLIIKLKSPGVISSLGKNNVIPRLIASSVYILSRPVLTTNAAFYHAEDYKKDGHDTSNSVSDSRRSKHKLSLISDMLLSNRLDKMESMDKIIPADISNGDILGAKLLEKLPYYADFIFPILKFMFTYYSQALFGNHFMLFFNGFKAQTKNKSFGLMNLDEFYRELAIYTGITILDSTYINDDKIKVGRIFEVLNSQDTLSFSIFSNTIHIHTIMRSVSYLNIESVKFSEKEESFLFPFKKDYEILSSIYNSIDLSKGVKSINYRRRQRADLNITSQDEMSFIKLEHVLVWKWFDINNLKYSIVTLKTMFDQYKEIIPWIQETAEETLKSSPFVNHIQLQNFISRQDKPHRSVHLVGTCGKNRYGIINLISVIRHNYSNGMMFVDLQDSNARQTYSDLSIYCHTATLLSQFPCTTEFKNTFMYKLLTEGPSLPSSDLLGSKLAKFNLIQQMLIKNPRIIMDQVLERDVKTIIKQRDIITKKLLPPDEMDALCAKVQSYVDDQGWDYNNKDEIIDYVTSRFDHPSTAFILNYLSNEETCGYYEETIEELYEEAEPEESQIDFINSIRGTSAMMMFKKGKISDEDDYQDAVCSYQDWFHTFLHRLKILKLGMSGYYTTPQRYDSKKKYYYGRGVWEGFMDNVNVRLVIQSDSNGNTHLYTIELSSAKSISATLKSVTKWCDDNNVLNKYPHKMLYSIPKDSYIYGRLKNFKLINEDISTSCPIIITNTLKTISHHEIDYFKLDLSERSVRLLGYYKSPKNDAAPRCLSVIFIPLTPYDVNMNMKTANLDNFPMITSLRPLLKDWILYRDTFESRKVLLTDMIKLDNYPANRYVIDSKYTLLLKILWKESIRRYFGSASPHLLNIEAFKEESSTATTYSDEELLSIFTSLSHSMSIRMDSILESLSDELSLTISDSVLSYWIPFGKDEVEYSLDKILLTHPIMDSVIKLFDPKDLRIVISSSTTKQPWIPASLINFKTLFSNMCEVDESAWKIKDNKLECILAEDSNENDLLDD